MEKKKYSVRDTNLHKPHRSADVHLKTELMEFIHDLKLGHSCAGMDASGQLSPHPHPASDECHYAAGPYDQQPLPDSDLYS